MTITDFLTARLDEEESALRAIQDNSEPWRGEWAGDEANFALRTRNGWSLARAVTVEAGFPPGVLAHIARHDPARVLREVAAKRARLTLMIEAIEEMDKLLADDDAEKIDQGVGYRPGQGGYRRGETRRGNLERPS